MTAPGTGRAEAFLRVEWTDEVTGARGFLVVDRLANGVASGGLRMHPGVTMDEVADLAYAMTVKEAIANRPHLRRPLMGGAKGGIDADPASPGAQGVLDRYVRAMRPLCVDYWSFGEDLGLRQEQVDLAATRAGLDSTLVAAYPLLQEPPADAMGRIATAFGVRDAGVSVGDLVGGLGVAEAGLTCLRRNGHPPADATAVVQGFGSIGGATARFLARAGVRVVGVADAAGTIRNAAGLDVEALLRSRDRHGLVDRAALGPKDETDDRLAWVDVPADLVVPAAVSYCVDRAAAERIQARWLVQGANVPCTPAAEDVLHRRGVAVVPDVVANSGANSWWWWVFFGDVADPSSAAESYALVRTQMTALVDELLELVDATGLPPRAAAQDIAARRLAGPT